MDELNQEARAELTKEEKDAFLEIRKQLGGLSDKSDDVKKRGAFSDFSEADSEITSSFMDPSDELSSDEIDPIDDNIAQADPELSADLEDETSSNGDPVLPIDGHETQELASNDQDGFNENLASEADDQDD